MAPANAELPIFEFLRKEMPIPHTLPHPQLTRQRGILGAGGKSCWLDVAMWESVQEWSKSF